MTRYEYTAVPAPLRVEKNKDTKTASDRYAAALTAELNRMAKDGWEYIRADVLPSEERSGLTGRSTVYHNLLIFRKESHVQASQKSHRKPVKQSPPVKSTVPDEPPAETAKPETVEPSLSEVSTNNEEK